MDFTEEQFADLVDEMRAGVAEYGQRLSSIPFIAARAGSLLPVPAAVRAAIRWLAGEVVRVGEELRDLVVDLLDGVTAPLQLLHGAWEWRDIRGSATGVASALTDQTLVVDDSGWSGSARAAYQTVVLAQSRAATQVAVIADGTAGCLTECAAAGVAFYLSLAVVLARLIAATVAAVAAFGSAVLCWAGAALVIEEAGLNAVTISAALAALGLCLSTQAKDMVALHGLAVDQTNFPGGRWPEPHVDSYSDGTVTDGDADWSLRR